MFPWDFGDSATVLRQKFCDSATVEQRCAIKETGETFVITLEQEVIVPDGEVLSTEKHGKA